ncbi:MAG TPA: HAD-IA family hydrolase [Stellaceae bacterium]|nr:HAD-IA family hydrolase [Stellaceae bacterium]
MDSHRPRAVLFDLLTALIDSWTLWNTVAGSEADGRRWRGAYLERTYGEGRYRPYELLVQEAAEAVGLARGLGERLAERYAELAPWPEVAAVLGPLQGGVRLGIVTNCSEALGRIAASCTGIAFDSIVTAERAGFYKPHPDTYRLGLAELGVDPADCLFVAGSAYDLFGAAAVGLTVFWHDRIGMAMPQGAPPPLWHERSLHRLSEIVSGGIPFLPAS